MDPRTFTVKPCPAAYATKSNADISNAVSIRRDFFNSVGKIGDLQVLNSVGAGSIGTGLRTLASISNSIRTGCGSIPSSIGDSLDKGASWVLEHIGIAPTFIETLQSLHPEVANQAWSQAQVIFDNIQSGYFKTTDIPFYLQDFQNLERLAKGVFTPGNDRLNSLSSFCEASPYAVDMIARAPKYKFLFMVQFVTASGYSELDEVMRGMAFVVKKSSRPKISYKTEEVNFYNYRTKLITRAEFDEITMSFHDDILNNTTTFYTSYLRAMSPITNISPDSIPTHSSLEQQGMNFSNKLLQNQQDIPFKVNQYAATIGPLNNGNKQSIFKEIKLYHVFDSGNQVTTYHFINPRITQLIPDDVDMSAGSEGNELSLTFSYDNIYVHTQPMSELDSTFRGAQSDAFYQLRYNDTASAMKGPNNSGIAPFGPPASGSNTCDPLSFVNTKGNDGTIIEDTLNSAINDFMTVPLTNG